MQIHIPCFDESDEKLGVGHYFLISVNMKKNRFELLDSLGGTRYEQFFFRMVRLFKAIWKQAFKKSGNLLKPSNIDDFATFKISVPQQGNT